MTIANPTTATPVENTATVTQFPRTRATLDLLDRLNMHSRQLNALLHVSTDEHVSEEISAEMRMDYLWIGQELAKEIRAEVKALQEAQV